MDINYNTVFPEVRALQSVVSALFPTSNNRCQMFIYCICCIVLLYQFVVLYINYIFLFLVSLNMHSVKYFTV